MDEPVVVDTIKRWLEEKWKNRARVDCGQGQNVDFLVSEILYLPWFNRPWIVHYEQVECKGTDSNVHRAIGQCLDYFWSYGRIPTYLAVPENFLQYETLERIIKYFKLPIGILSVNGDRVVSLRMTAPGKTRWFCTFANGEGTLISRPP